MIRAFQSDGCSGATMSFHDQTSSKRGRSAAKPEASFSDGVISGMAALLDTSRIRRPSCGPNRPSSIAAASVIAPNRVEA
jgi:hypothetical protein